MGGFWALSTATVMRLVAEHDVPRALSVIFTGVPIATISAAALGSYLGDVIGWRNVFLLATALSVATLVLQYVTLPRMTPERPTPLGTLVSVIKRPGMGAGIVALSWRPSLNVELRTVARDAKAMGVLFIAEGIAAPIAGLMFVIAVSLGPISLVSTTTAARPLFVLALSALLSTPAWNLLNEPLDRETLGLKVAAVALIVGGVAGIALL